jgi:hypothetical protein
MHVCLCSRYFYLCTISPFDLDDKIFMYFSRKNLIFARHSKDVATVYHAVLCIGQLCRHRHGKRLLQQTRALFVLAKLLRESPDEKVGFRRQIIVKALCFFICVVGLNNT